MRISLGQIYYYTQSQENIILFFYFSHRNERPYIFLINYIILIVLQTNL